MIAAGAPTGADLLAVDPPALEAAGIAGCGWLQDPHLRVQDEVVLDRVDASDPPMAGVAVDHAVRCQMMTPVLRETTCPVRQPRGAFRRALVEHSAGAMVSLVMTNTWPRHSPPAGTTAAPRTRAWTRSTRAPSGTLRCFAEGLRCAKDAGPPGVFNKCRSGLPLPTAVRW